jgi:hypothetical protein
MDDANLNCRQTLRLGPQVAFAQVGVVGFDGPIEIKALRLYGLPEAAPALFCGSPTLAVAQRAPTSSPAAAAVNAQSAAAQK